MKKHLSLFITSAAALVALAYVYFGFLPGQRSIREMRDDLSQQQKYLAESTKLVAVISDLENQILECRTYIGAWRADAPNGSKMADLISRITAEAAQAGVQLVAFHPAAAERHAMLRELPANLKVEGSFHSLADFLRRLESLSSSFWIPNVNLRPVSEDGQVLRCELTLSIFSDSTDIAD